MIQLLQGDAIEKLATIRTGSVQTVITSPPYYGLRRYTTDPREIGQESAPDCLAWARRRIVGVTPTTDEDGETYYLPTYGAPEPPCGACYVCALRAVFAQLWRVLRDDGTCWINLGDSMSMDSKWGGASGGKNYTSTAGEMPRGRKNAGIPDKNILLIPARVALALQSDGWIVRSDVIWSKPNPMPESVTDRPTRAHEYVFLLSKQARYYYDAAAIAEPATSFEERQTPGRYQLGFTSKRAKGMGVLPSGNEARSHEAQPARKATRNKRSVWTIATRPYAGAHFATMPEALIEPCLLASSSAQACETCGAAWGRVVERTKGDEEAIDRPKHLQSTRSTLSLSGNGSKEWAERGSKSRDLGFAPRCACVANTGAASSVVLDPFAGTGTVLRVAERFGRDAIGIELNPDYGELSDARTNGVQKELFV